MSCCGDLWAVHHTGWVANIAREREVPEFYVEDFVQEVLLYLWQHKRIDKARDRRLTEQYLVKKFVTRFKQKYRLIIVHREKASAAVGRPRKVTSVEPRPEVYFWGKDGDEGEDT